MKRMLFLLLMSIAQLTIQGQIVETDSLPVYDLLLKKLPVFLKNKIRCWRALSNELFEKENGYGVLFIDSLNTNGGGLRFSYYDEKNVFRECSENAWGICHIDTIPVFLKGIKDEKVFHIGKENVKFVRRKYFFDGTIDPFFIYIRLKYETH